MQELEAVQDGHDTICWIVIDHLAGNRCLQKCDDGCVWAEDGSITCLCELFQCDTCLLHRSGSPYIYILVIY